MSLIHSSILIWVTMGVVASLRRSRVYQCPLKFCDGNVGTRISGDKVGNLKCNFCGSEKKEIPRAQVTSDQIIAMLVDVQSFKSTTDHMYQRYIIYFKDELSFGLELGECYDVVISRHRSYYRAWGVQPYICEPLRRAEQGLPSSLLPSGVQQLLIKLQSICPQSPWVLTCVLSSQLASHIYPVGTLFHLKTGLLLSLASQKMSQSPIPILAIGPDCHRLLECASALSSRRVICTSSSLSIPLGGFEGSMWLDAGALLLAKGGVCYLGDWCKFCTGKNSVASQIISVIESCTINFTFITSVNPTVSYPLKSAVWTLWSQSHCETRSNQDQLKTLIDVFGLPFMGDISADSKIFSDKLLSQAMGVTAQCSEFTVPDEQLAKFLEIVNSLTVEISFSASQLLRSYFVACRRERPHCLPITALRTMTSLSEANARLNLRTEVIYEDAVLVIFLYEIAICTLYGQSLTSSSVINISQFSLGAEEYLIPYQMDLLLYKFSKWLDNYIKSFVNDSSQQNVDQQNKSPYN